MLKYSHLGRVLSCLVNSCGSRRTILLVLPLPVTYAKLPRKQGIIIRDRLAFIITGKWEIVNLDAGKGDCFDYGIFHTCVIDVHHCGYRTEAFAMWQPSGVADNHMLTYFCWEVYVCGGCAGVYGGVGGGGGLAQG